MNLTAKQNGIVRFSWGYRRSHGIAPTLSEIAEALGVSKITVHEHIGLLEKKGALKKEKYQSRSLTLSRGIVKELEAVDRERERLGIAGSDHGSSKAAAAAPPPAGTRATGARATGDGSRSQH